MYTLPAPFTCCFFILHIAIRSIVRGGYLLTKYRFIKNHRPQPHFDHDEIRIFGTGENQSHFYI